jgi:hypothetical protein
VDEPNKKDIEHLRQLSIFHFVGAGLSLAALAFIAVHFTIMNAVFSNPDLFKGAQGGPPPAQFFAMLKIFYAIFAIWFVATGVMNLMSAIYLRQRRNRTFSMVVAGVNCLYMPLGTVLGVFTFIVLGRDSVVALYEVNKQP